MEIREANDFLPQTKHKKYLVQLMWNRFSELQNLEVHVYQLLCRYARSRPPPLSPSTSKQIQKAAEGDVYRHLCTKKRTENPHISLPKVNFWLDKIYFQML